MKAEKLLFLPLLFSVGLCAQNEGQRLEIQKSNNKTELLQLKSAFQAQHDQDEIAVNKYLATNRLVQRTFEKDGSVYFLKSIDRDGNPVYINTKSNIASGELIKANQLYNGGSLGANITGTGMIAGIWDGGQVRDSHELLTGKVTMQPSQTVTSAAGNDHMTHVSGTMVGKDIGNTARGIAYNATSKNYDWDNDQTEMIGFAADGYLISNHSYGLGNGPTQAQWTFGAYNDTANEWDAITKNAPFYLPFVAAGNEQASNGSGKTGALQGYDVITGSSAAKNVITVGAVNADRSMSDYSNFGPTDDGRVKPDVVARGTGINSSVATGDTSYSGDGSDSSGTSYASPAAAASGLLLQQYYYSLNNKYMKASMLKALMLHSADDAGNPGPDLKFGWGILNIERAAQIIKDDKTNGKARMHTFTNNPANDSVSEISISSLDGGTGSGTGEIKASICWTDNEGTIQTAANGVDPTASRLVYNFDVKFRRATPFIQNSTYKQFTMATKTDVATLGTNWFQNNVDNFKQTVIPAGGTDGSNYFLYLRKSASSPAAIREVSAIITGLKSKTPTLAVDDNMNETANIVFYSKIDSRIKLISNTSKSFGNYSIYDMSGKTIKKGNIKTNEIEFSSHPAGMYIINYEANGKTNSTKFMMK